MILPSARVGMVLVLAMVKRVWMLVPLMTGVGFGAVKPESVAAYRAGMDALASRLWEVSASKFEQALGAKDLDVAGRQQVRLRWVESLVRGGRGDEALKVLGDREMQDHPAVPYWRAQALAAGGHYGEALAVLEAGALGEGAPWRTEAIFTQAALMEVLGERVEALSVLEPLTRMEEVRVATQAKMRRVLLLLSLGKADEALAAMPEDKGLSAGLRARLQWMRGRAHLLKGANVEAAGEFSALLGKDDVASRAQHPFAAIGLAEAKAAGGDRVAAVDGLLAYLQKNEKAAAGLGRVFEALIGYLPDDVAPNDAILERLESWTPAPVPGAPSGLIPGDGVVGVNTTPPAVEDEFGVQVMFHRALALRREGSAESMALAKKLLTRVRLEHPGHALVWRALLEGAKWDLQDGRPGEAEAALVALSSAEAGLGEASVAAAASLVQAKAAFLAKDYGRALEALKEAEPKLEGRAKGALILNVAAAAAAAERPDEIERWVELAKESGMEADLQLERALYLASKMDGEALQELDRFVVQHPNHARVGEARLAMVMTILASPKPDLALAAAVMELLEEKGGVDELKVRYAGVRLAARKGEWARVVADGVRLVEEHPTMPRVDEVRYEVANAKFRSGSTTEAQLWFSKLATDLPGSPFAEVSWLMAARSAVLGATAQSKEQSVELFDRVIAMGGDFASSAKVEKAEVLMRLGRYGEAAGMLEPWLKEMEKDDPQRLRVALLLGDVWYASDRLEEVMRLYTDLLPTVSEGSSRRNEIRYRMGLAQMEMGRPEQALETYLEVLNEASRVPVDDWQWVDLCAVSARRILEEGKKWRAAIEIARRHEALGSPGSKEAAERATMLGLEHMIWED